MAFPQTRLTLIKRLTTEGSEQDWRAFHDDYWVAVCRFAMRWRGLSVEDAEDVAAEVFQAILANDLLGRWHEHRTAKLRTLICGVAKNIIANRTRVEDGRQRILRDLAAEGALPASLWAVPEPSEEQEDAFYSAWVDDLLQRAINDLLTKLHGEGKGDYFRVLHGRVCEQVSTREIAELLSISATAAENYFKAAKKRMAGELESAMRSHVQRYCDDESVAGEFATEWSRLSNHLQQHGGLEAVLRSQHEQTQNAGEISRTSTRYRETQSSFSKKPGI
ncbi:MAG TPA: sigma-70 family RNA polymerase sigma factor [Pirellulaceae bacterium]|nr:sigma-70 family RNA polymerase sigma factor [Pirellulaceae bacterium]